jgi:hypothetical protein
LTWHRRRNPLADLRHRLVLEPCEKPSTFFVVPDVLLSWIALNQPRKAWIARGWAVAGALIGGTLMYAWGAADVDSALAALEHVPAVSPTMCDAVSEQFHTHGIIAIFLGPITGTPYKI